MKFKDVPAIAKKVAGNVKLKGKQYAPEILLVTGIVSGVATVIVACKSTLKTPEIVDEAKEKVDMIHTVSERQEKEGLSDNEEEYTPEDREKDLAIVYVQTSAKFIKLYAPTIVLGAVSLTSILASQNILRTRNAALASAYAVVDRTFKDYRGRVVERFGEKVDDELRYNIKAKTFEKVEVDEDGVAITKREKVEVVDENTIDDVQSRWFDESCVAWQNDSEANRLYLIQNQRYLNDLLQARGHLFLNEVFDVLGLSRTRVGQELGWIYDPEDSNRANYVDFGLKRECNRDFINSYEKYALLTFNYDGPILSCLK